MFRANIFRKNIPPDGYKESIDHVLGFNNSIVEITSKQIVIAKDTSMIYRYDIEFFEKDFLTTTHIGKFENGAPFRLVQPYGISLEMFNSQNNAKGAFTIGSLNADGYSIYFLLTDSADKRKVDIIIEEDAERVERLVEGSIMALQFGLQSKFIEITKRLLQYVETNPLIITNHRDGDKIIQYMRENLSFYNDDEQKIISKL